MMYSYITLDDETTIVCSDIQPDQTIIVNVERPRDYGFDSASCTLPSYSWTSHCGFSEHDLDFLMTTIRNNAPLIYRLSIEAGKVYA